ncbi:HEAT repeat domain-containing protein [Anditalea andensis]|uniref:HEAT repeat domain-containing protein n=1 Tax=Anditalea andensis TaxID=1048983 RepID=A0A074LJK3_9BACT|nr:HEAT repeat domain-containing protein [Anditalea andensis]KEO73982.1 hypothetical protein EL17_07460 [Anditalea andensis]
MDNNTENLFAKMCDKQEEEAFKYADKLAEIGGDEILNKLIELVKSDDIECVHLAARALANIDNNQSALDTIMEAIHDNRNRHQNGALVQALEGFDLSLKFVDIFRIYLFGNFKSSLLAKEYLDYVEFDVTPRVIKKVEKHWKHFINNSKNDEGFEIKKAEVEEILSEIKAMFEE